MNFTPSHILCVAALSVGGMNLSPTLDAQAESKVFEQFQGSGGSWRVLSDFSYTGYHRCEAALPSPSGERLEVADFGAVPDDGFSDRDALQAAFDEAERLGGAVLVFARGEYTLDATEGETMPLTLRVGNTVLLGAGSGQGGTTFRMARPLSPADPAKMYSTPFILNVALDKVKEKSVAKVLSKASRGGFELEVSGARQMAVGDWVTLFLEDADAVSAFFGEREVSDLWTRLQTQGVPVAERHQIKSVSGNRVVFAEPLQVDVDPAFAWELREYHALEEVGIEGIRFVGGWKEGFVHHRSARDDSAWSCLKFLNVRNSWIRDVAFEDWNYSLNLENCSFVSALRMKVSGTPGHFSVHTRRGYGNLIGLVSDSQGNHHGPSVGYQSVSSVYWRYEGSPESSFDSHSTGPYATLLDASSGGWTYGRTGGPLAGMPNHMGYLTIWNYERTGGAEKAFDFWREDPNKRDRFLNPLVVGFHGMPTSFETSSLGAFESLGAPVEPESLFESQLALRLGALPEFLKTEMRLWNAQQQ